MVVVLVPSGLVVVVVVVVHPVETVVPFGCVVVVQIPP